MYEIIDQRGTLYSGDYDEISKIWNFMISDLNHLFKLYYNADDFGYDDILREKEDVLKDWVGDLKFIQIMLTHK